MPKLPPRTQKKVDLIATRDDINSYDRYYFGYQYGLGSEYIAPYLKSEGVKLEGATICEIGCGESGVLAALADPRLRGGCGVD